MSRLIYILLAIIISTSTTLKSEVDNHCKTTQIDSTIRVGAQRMELYLPIINGKKVGVVTNHTGVVKSGNSDIPFTHIVDTLLSLGVNIQAIFAPEHGFRGDADAGATVNGYTDKKTDLKVTSLYGTNKKPNIKEIGRAHV